MHFCPVEAMALLSFLGAVPLAWAWVRNKLRR